LGCFISLVDCLFKSRASFDPNGTKEFDAIFKKLGGNQTLPTFGFVYRFCFLKVKIYGLRFSKFRPGYKKSRVKRLGTGSLLTSQESEDRYYLS